MPTILDDSLTLTGFEDSLGVQLIRDVLGAANQWGGSGRVAGAIAAVRMSFGVSRTIRSTGGVLDRSPLSVAPAAGSGGVSPTVSAASRTQLPPEKTAASPAVRHLSSADGKFAAPALRSVGSQIPPGRVVLPDETRIAVRTSDPRLVRLVLRCLVRTPGSRFRVSGYLAWLRTSASICISPQLTCARAVMDSPGLFVPRVSGRRKQHQ